MKSCYSSHQNQLIQVECVNDQKVTVNQRVFLDDIFGAKGLNLCRYSNFLIRVGWFLFTLIVGVLILWEADSHNPPTTFLKGISSTFGAIYLN